MFCPIRKSLRLECYDYSLPGYYFVTICCKGLSFGGIENVQMRLNDQGKIACKFWLQIPAVYENVGIDAFVIMPDHIHGIIVIENNNVGAIIDRPHDYGLLSRIIKMYKWAVTRAVHENGDPSFRWQRSFHDRIIRNERELHQIREYIRNNPQQRDLDK